MVGFFSFLKEENGQFSGRRVTALLFSLAAIACLVLAILKTTDWRIVAVSFGAPAVCVLVLYLFTTWEDIKKLISAARGKE